MGNEVNGTGQATEKSPGYIVGMDAHSRKISLCIAEWAPGSDPAVIRELTDIPLAMMEDGYRKHVPKGAVTVLEASANAFNIVKRLKAVGYEARVAYSDILRGLSRKDKVNDRIDARKLVAYIGLNPMVCASGETGSPDVLSSYGQRILKTYFIEVGQALVRRRTAHGIGRWARAKIAQGKPYLVMCAAAGRKAVIYAWHSMTGHPLPDRESERMFRDKLMKLYRELGSKAANTLGDKTSRAYAERVMKPLYAHLEGDGAKPPSQAPVTVA